MKKTPGESPGSSVSAPGTASPEPAYARPGLALVIAACGFGVAILVLIAYPAVRRRWSSLPEWALSVTDLLALSLPLIVAVLAAGVAASQVGIARATGIRFWRLSDVLVGLAVGLVARALVELVAPTTGSLGGPFGQPDLATVIVFAAGACIISPVVEELFFRGLGQRALGDALAGAGRTVAGAAAVLASTAAFVALHAVAAGQNVPLSLIVGTGAVGLGCGILTLVTGRLGGAIVAHVLFNASGVLLLVL